MGKVQNVLLLLVATLLMSPVALAAQECLETDGGDNIYLMGTISHPGSKEVSDVQADVCFNGKYLYEQNCDGGRKVSCPNGCSDGRCRTFGEIVEPTTECMDTDPEDNPYFKGSTSAEADYYGGVREDYCTDSNTVFEQNCNGGQEVVCEAGCADGRCKPRGSVGSKQTTCFDSDNGDIFGIDAGNHLVPETLLVSSIEVNRGDKFKVVNRIIVDLLKQLFYLVAGTY